LLIEVHHVFSSQGTKLNNSALIPIVLGPNRKPFCRKLLYKDT